MANHKVPEYREVVQEILHGKRKKNRFREPIEVGDTVLFFSARPVFPPHDALEDVADDNPIYATVRVIKVETGPDDRYPYFISWDIATASAGW
jgi:hypothetical protein